MRRPWPVLFAVVGLLLVLAAPALSTTFTEVDPRALPVNDPAAQATAALAGRFPGQEADPVDVVLPGAAGDVPAVRSYAEALSRLPGVIRVTTPAGVVVGGAVVAPNPQPQTFTAGSDTRVSVVSDVRPRTPQAQALIGDIRRVPAPSACQE